MCVPAKSANKGREAGSHPVFNDERTCLERTGVPSLHGVGKRTIDGVKALDRGRAVLCVPFRITRLFIRCQNTLLKTYEP